MNYLQIRDLFVEHVETFSGEGSFEHRPITPAEASSIVGSLEYYGADIYQLANLIQNFKYQNVGLDWLADPGTVLAVLLKYMEENGHHGRYKDHFDFVLSAAFCMTPQAMRWLSTWMQGVVP